MKRPEDIPVPSPEAFERFSQGFQADMQRHEEVKRQLRLKSAKRRLPHTVDPLSIVINIPPRIS